MDQTAYVITFSIGFAFGIFMAGVIWHVYRLAGPVPPEWGPPHGVSSSDSVVPPVHVTIPVRADIATPRSDAPAYGLKITGYRDPLMWYANRVGDIVPYKGAILSERVYRSIDNGGFNNIVKFDDAEIVEL